MTLKENGPKKGKWKQQKKKKQTFLIEAPSDWEREKKQKLF